MKTADEMFMELGYKKKVCEDRDVIRYLNPPYEIRFIDGFAAKFHNGFGKDCFLHGEILACAQLIREMEVRDENSIDL